MKRSVLRRDVAPLTLLFATLVVATIVVDAVLHRLELASVGRYLGIPGVLLILLSLGYSLRKHQLLTRGQPGRWLQFHKVVAWFGSLLVLVHAGIHFHAVLPWLATGAMLVNVASGLTGVFLLQRARRHVELKKQLLLAEGLSAGAVEARLEADAATLEWLKRWRTIHLPIAAAFGTLALGHIVAVFVFWGWR